MERRAFFLFLLLILVAPGILSAGDPPHNEASGISCSNCHGQTLLDNQSPFYTENKSDLAYNSVCTGVCHNQNPVGYDTGYEYHGEASSPRVLSHTPGGTVIKCIVCHHNHDQDQIYAGKNNKNQFFIATGTLATDATTPIFYNSGTDRTTITYATLAATDPDPTNRWNDLTLLAKKTGDGRGAMLVPIHTSRKRWPVYIIKSIDTDAKTITVKGNVASASNLGIFYGQSIRRSVNYEPVAGMPKTVSFYRPKGNNGLTNSSATGICQVCHESGKVSYWTNDGNGRTHNPDADCMGCHLHSTGFTHGGATGSDCNICHDTQVEHDKRVASAGCATCHTVGTQAEIDAEHDSSGQCAPCHGYGGNVLNPVEVADAIQHGKDGIDQNCEACHTDSGSSSHHQTAMASNVNCTVLCHKTVNHTAVVAAESGCVSCHTATAGSASTVPLSLASAEVHDSCLTCHTFDADKRGILRDFTNQKGVNGSGGLPNGGTIGGTNGGGNCSVCHTVTPEKTYHHTTQRAQVGQCETCHVDPRPAWGLAANDGVNYNPGDNGNASGLPRPTQMACRECHVHFSGVQMTVTKYTRSNYTSYKTDWNRSTVHTVPMTAARINNYGICLSCHYVGNSVSAPPVALWHAHPGAPKAGQSPTVNSAWTFYPENEEGWPITGKTYLRGSDSSELASGDAAHYVPGRTKSKVTDRAPASGIGGFNIFAQHYGIRSLPGTWSVYASWDNDEDYYSFRGQGYDTPYFSRVAVPNISKIGLAGNVSTFTRAVPIFESYEPANASPSVAADDVNVSSAIYSGSSLTVVASTSNSDGCLTLTVEYGAESKGMEGTSPNCTAIFDSPSYPDDGTTVAVSTTNSSGIDVIGYPITDNTAAADILADKDTNTWYNTPDVIFTNTSGFSSGGVKYCRYVWNQNNSHIFLGSETEWSSGSLIRTSASAGDWFLHVKSYNNNDQAIGVSTTYGPFQYDNSAPVISGPIPTDGGSGITVNSNLTFSLSDTYSGVNWETFQIVLQGNNGYPTKTYYDSETSVVSKIGAPESYYVTVNPDTNFNIQEEITVTVSVDDAAGNSLITPPWVFTTGNNNSAPVLAWTGETNYVSDGVNKDSDIRGSNFTFRVKYTDDDNDRPVTVQVWVDRDDNNSYGAGEKFVMDQDDTGDVVYTDGKIYTKSISLEYVGNGTLKYRFYALDGTFDATGTPVTDKSGTVTLDSNGTCTDETFSAPAGQFDDNSPGSYYNNSASCKKIIQVPGATAIRVNFTEFDLGVGDDFIKVYDGPSTTSPLIGTYTGLKMPTQLVSSGSSMLVHFTSDHTGGRPGWTAFYTVDGLDTDTDSDGWYDSNDNCPADANQTQVESDGDGIGDACDNCPTDVNADQADSDVDGIGDVCDPDADIDGDTVQNQFDNCLSDPNPPSDCDSNPVTPDEQCDADSDGIGDACDPDADIDGDTVQNQGDNCPTDANTDQANTDGDTNGDVCDVCPSDPDDDKDGDGICAGAGFSVPMTGQNDLCPADPDPSCTDPVKRVIFASINTYNGDFDHLSITGDGVAVDGNGIPEAHAVCNAEKPANVTKVKAFMSGGTNDEIRDLPTHYMNDHGFDLDAAGKKIYVLNRTTGGFSVLKNSWTLLMEPATPAGDLVTSIADGTGLGYFTVYTGSVGNGATDTAKNCGTWSNTTENDARRGYSDQVIYNWWFGGNGTNVCSVNQRILCIGIHE